MTIDADFARRRSAWPSCRTMRLTHRQYWPRIYHPWMRAAATMMVASFASLYTAKRSDMRTNRYRLLAHGPQSPCQSPNNSARRSFWDNPLSEPDFVGSLHRPLLPLAPVVRSPGRESTQNEVWVPWYYALLGLDSRYALLYASARICNGT